MRCLGLTTAAYVAVLLGVWFSMFRNYSLPSSAKIEESTKNSSKLA